MGESGSPGEINLGGPDWPSASSTKIDSEDACAKECNERAGCIYYMWFDDRGCRTQTSCTQTVSWPWSVSSFICKKEKYWGGPTTKIWDDNQCTNIENKDSSHTLEDCKQACQASESCTAINFDKLGGCALRACTLPVPVPNWDHQDYEGYYHLSDCTEESYVGCYVDDASRDLPYGPKTNGYDHFSCNKACRGYIYFSLQASGQCFCGNAYSTQPQYVKTLDSECGGQRGLGGPWINTIFRTCGAQEDCVLRTKLASCNTISDRTTCLVSIESRSLLLLGNQLQGNDSAWCPNGP